jgi:hypothetical protein
VTVVINASPPATFTLSDNPEACLLSARRIFLTRRSKG